jgi:hypothetical protein
MCFSAGLTSTVSLNALLALLFQMILVGALLPFTMISLYVADRRMFTADCASNLYSPLTWFLAQTLVAIPFTLSSAWVGFPNHNLHGNVLTVFLISSCGGYLCLPVACSLYERGWFPRVGLCTPCLSSFIIGSVAGYTCIR